MLVSVELWCCRGDRWQSRSQRAQGVLGLVNLYLWQQSDVMMVANGAVLQHCAKVVTELWLPAVWMQAYIYE